VLTGSARAAQEARERAEALAARQETESRQRAVERERAVLEAQIAALQAKVKAGDEDLKRMVGDAGAQARTAAREQTAMSKRRMADE